MQLKNVYLNVNQVEYVTDVQFHKGGSAFFVGTTGGKTLCIKAEQGETKDDLEALRSALINVLAVFNADNPESQHELEEVQGV